MRTYWKDNAGNDESFWEHEWGKHGTCISTLDPNCYINYTPQEEVVDYFERTVRLFSRLNTYDVRYPMSTPPTLPQAPCFRFQPLTSQPVPRRPRHLPLQQHDVHLRPDYGRSKPTPRRQRHHRVRQDLS